MKKTKKNIIILLAFTVLLVVTIFGYFHMKNEQENIKIDEYNFTQLDKAKEILENLPEEDNKLYTVEEFNTAFNSKITPIKNCYYINTVNGKEDYIFGFKLESRKYIKEYGTEYYAYPKYDLSPHYFCGGSPDCSDDWSLWSFQITTKNPCRD